MASSLTMKEIKEQALSLADLTGSEYGGDLAAHINAEAAVLYSELALTYEDYFTTSVDYAVVADQEKYAIPEDMWKLERISWKESTTGDRVPLTRLTKIEFDYPSKEYPAPRAYGHGLGYMVRKNEIWIHPIPTEGGYFELLYLPELKKIKKDTDKLSFGVPTVWEDYIPLAVAVRLAVMEGSDEAAGLKVLRDETLARIRGSKYNRDAGEPRRIQDVVYRHRR